MKTIIILVMLNGYSGFNNFSMATVQGFETMGACETAKREIMSTLDLLKATGWKCIEVKK